MPVKKGPVIYIAGEGQSGLMRRRSAWEIARGVSSKGAPLYLNQGVVSLIDEESMLDVVHALERLICELGSPPALVVLDTWSRVLGGDDTLDAREGVEALDKLRSQYDNFATLVIHHEGYTKGRSRGWSGLKAALDVELHTELVKDDVVRVKCTKSKDSEKMKPMAFRLTPVNIVDDDGKPATSAVLNLIDCPPDPEPAKSKKSTTKETGGKQAKGGNQILALGILKQLAVSGPVTVEAWREACIAGGLNKDRFNEVKRSFVKSGRIEINNNVITVCERTS
jgi:hypothetical protein